MSVPITTAQDLKDVLDAIYNNNSQYDTYQNLALYYNDISRTATIFAVDDEDAEVPTKNVVAVFNPENVVTLDNSFFVTIMKSAIVNISTEETSVYDFALGAYVSVDTLLKNICVALGVSLTDAFSEANAGLYEDMSNIIRNEYGQALENNAPYIMKKFVDLDTQNEYYKSLVPLMCIVKIAIYLNNLGIFNTGEVNIQTEISMTGTYLTTVRYNSSNTPTSMQAAYDDNNIEYPSYADLGIQFRDKNDFISFIRNYYTTTIYIRTAPMITNGLDAFQKFLDQYDAEIDWNQFIYCYWVQTTSSATNTETFLLRTIPADKIAQITSRETIGGTIKYGFGGNNGQYTSSMLRIVKEDNTEYTTYTLTVSHNNSTQEDTITHNKSVNVFTNKGFFTYTNTNYTINNIKPTKYVKPYHQSVSGTEWHTLGTNNSPQAKIVDYFNELSVQTEYKDLELCYDTKYVMPYLDKVILEQQGFELHVNDLLYVADYNNLTHYIILRNANSVGFTFNSGQPTLIWRDLRQTRGLIAFPITDYRIWQSSEGGHWDEYPQEMVLAQTDFYHSASGNYSYQKIEFSENITIDIYKLGYDSSTHAFTVTTDQLTDQPYFNFYLYFNNSSFTFKGNNIFKVIDIENGGSEIEGLSLIEGATYPKNVIDLTTFNTKYPNWWKTQTNNPQIVNGVLSSNVTSTQWGAVAISNTTPSTQQGASDGEIDFTDTELIDDISNDIEDAIDNDDTVEDEERLDHDVVPDDAVENTGTEPTYPSVADLPNPLVMGCLKQYVLDTYNLALLGTQMVDSSIWGAASNLLQNPLEAIISLQSGYLYNPAGAQSEAVSLNGHTYNQPAVSGLKLVTPFTDTIELGTLAVDFINENYLDIADTYMEVFLPWIGFVEVDITKFIGRYIRLTCRVDSMTGCITYNIHAVDSPTSATEDGQCLYEFTGMSYYNIPLKTDNFMRFYESLSGGKK